MMDIEKVWQNSIDEITNYDRGADGYVYAIELEVIGSEADTETHLYVGQTKRDVKQRVEEHISGQFEYKKDVPDPSGGSNNSPYEVVRVDYIENIFQEEIDILGWSLEQELAYLESEAGRNYAKYDNRFDKIIGAK
jgi:hypothetical protein